MSRSADIPDAVQRLVARLVRTTGPDLVVLFGSYARGCQSSASDVDLLVVVPDQAIADELSRRRAQLVASVYPRIDLVPATRAELSEATGERASFLRGVLEHGIILHRGAHQT